jgi:SAM-dependent methyltransferase
MGLLSSWLHKIRTNRVIHYVSGNVLDLGCGPATIYASFAYKISNYYGFEYDKFLVEQLRKKYSPAKFFQKNLDEDNFDLDIKFDYILLIAVIEHIFNQKHLFNEILKYLKPEGKIIITTPTVFGNDIVHKLGSSIGLFNKEVGQDDHIIIFNKKRFKVLANEFNLKIDRYSKFELGCNQLVIMSRSL